MCHLPDNFHTARPVLRPIAHEDAGAIFAGPTSVSTPRSRSFRLMALMRRAVIIRRELKRRYMLSFFQKLPPCLIGIDACATSHYWSRELQALVEGCALAEIPSLHPQRAGIPLCVRNLHQFLPRVSFSLALL